MMDKNTIYNIQVIDAFALEQTILYKTFHKAWVEYDPKEPSDEAACEPTHLCIKTGRYAMDQNGYYVGYEYYTARFQLFEKSSLAIRGIPYNLSRYVVLPKLFDIEIEPATTEPCHCNDHKLTEDINKTEKEIAEDCYNFTNECTCYIPPDEDFAYQEIQQVLEHCISSLIEAEYNPANGTWKLGDYEYKVGT